MPHPPEGLSAPEGFLDHVGHVVSGWVWLPADPGRRLRVEVRLQTDGGLRIALEAVADLHRADLEAAGKGDGRYGFTVPVPDDFTGSEHVVDVRLPDFAMVRLPGGPRTAILAPAPVVIRPARPVSRDVERLCALLSEAARLNGAQTWQAAAAPETLPERPDRCWLIAERKGRFVGHCRVEPGWPAAPGAFALGIELHPDVRGYGIGRALMLSAHRWAAGRGARIELAVLPHNARALRLYRALGYAELGTTVQPGTGELHLHMALPLPPWRQPDAITLLL